MNFNNAFAAVLSLVSTAALHSSVIVSDPSATCCLVTGEFGSKSFGPYDKWRSRIPPPRSCCAKTAAASIHLNVEHMAKRSSLRCESRAPFLVSRAATPRRPPNFASISSNCGNRMSDCADWRTCATARTRVHALLKTKCRRDPFGGLSISDAICVLTVLTSCANAAWLLGCVRLLNGDIDRQLLAARAELGGVFIRTQSSARRPRLRSGT